MRIKYDAGDNENEVAYSAAATRTETDKTLSGEEEEEEALEWKKEAIPNGYCEYAAERRDLKRKSHRIANRRVVPLDTGPPNGCP